MPMPGPTPQADCDQKVDGRIFQKEWESPGPADGFEDPAILRYLMEATTLSPNSRDDNSKVQTSSTTAFQRPASTAREQL